MPRLARLYVRTSLVYLAMGGLLGGFLLWNEGLPFAPVLWSLLPVHIGMLIWGWLLQFTMGVTYWILPREGNERPRAWLAGLAYGGLNAGLWLVALGAILALPWSMPLGGLAQALAALAFAVHCWPRVRPAITRSQRELKRSRGAPTGEQRS